MALLSVFNIEKAFGAETVFHGVSFELQENTKAGLIGVNGCGKTTLLKILTGEYVPEEGTVSLSKETVLGYMEQQMLSDPEKSAYDEVLTVFSALSDLEKELENINLRLQKESSSELIERQLYLHEVLEREGGLTYRSRTASTLSGLGFDSLQMALPVKNLSGGQQAKLRLAKMLLGKANLLLLDEPTNHLDISSVEWLEDFLRNWRGAFLVVSHDRYFLDAITGTTFELSHERLTAYKGNYTEYLRQKAENDLSKERRYQTAVKEIQRLEGVVKQQRQWNREKSIKKAESTLKKIGRIEETLERPDSPEKSIGFSFETVCRSGDEVLEAQDLSLSFGEKTLFRNVGMKLFRGERVFLIGANGCGKTSLLKIFLRQYLPTTGSFRLGMNVEIGYYDQTQKDLCEEKNVLSEIWDRYPTKTETEIRSALALFLFRGDDVYKQVSTLSGGERARLLLLRLMMSRANFLLLDEPTNHLDAASCEALEDALSSYEGTLLIVSHDRYLINKLADRIYAISDLEAKEYQGNYDFYLETRQEQKELTPVPVKVNEYKLKKEREATVRKQKSELLRLERQIEELDRERLAAEESLSDPAVTSDYEKLVSVTERLADIKKEGDALFGKWSSLSELLDSSVIS